MTEGEAWSRLKEGAAVTRQRVTLAKAFILQHFQQDTQRLLSEFHSHVDAPFPEGVRFGGPETEDSLKAASDALAWRLAFSEAIWELIHANAILPASTSMTREVRSLPWRRFAGAGYAMGEWTCDEVFLPVPQLIRRPPSAANAPTEVLVDGDLFLKELDIQNLDPEVVAALREAIKCFRHDLFLACLAMLGKASEAAWIKLGCALALALPEGQGAKAVLEFEDPFTGIGRKINQVLKLYERPDVRQALEQSSGVRLQDLRATVIWADCVRESRNSIHFGA